MQFQIINDLILPFIISLFSSAIVVFLGVKSIREYIKQIEVKKEYGLLAKFWSIDQKKAKKFVLIFGCEPPKDEECEVEPRVGYSQSFAVYEITQLLQKIHGENIHIQQVILQRDESLPKDVFNENVIIFGGELVLSKFRTLNLNLGIPYYQYQLDLKNRSFVRRNNEKIIESYTSIVDLESKNVISDFGTVTRIINPLNNNLLILFNANYSAGLLGAVFATTQKDRFPFGSFNEKTTAQQLIVEVPDIRDNLLHRGHPIVPKSWHPFKIDNNIINKTIDAVTDSRRNPY